ncbi:MAG TPA: hypothetical protein VKZ61_05705 [Thermomicrobiales bacterium]|jgi:hypothetical protein|nr:hypothetical protein [Thermomicrobiales bacterium]
MLLRLLFLISFLGYTTGPDYREEEEDKLGGQGFGALVLLFAGLGVLVLIGLIVLAVMSITGNFESEFFDPVI